MNNYLPLTALLVTLIAIPIAFGAIQVSSAEGTPILGYPYDTTGDGGSGTKYDSTGSRFTLNSTASITSISCLMSGGFNPSSPSDVYSYRFAIYTDNNGSVGTLVSQTEEGVFVGAVGGSQNVWNTQSFAQTVQLSSGTYWLMAVHNATQYIGIGHEYPVTGNILVSSAVGGMTFPTSLITTFQSTFYTPDMVACIYASGEGASSLSPPDSNSRQLVSRLSVGCTVDATSKMEITGNLTANYVGIASVPLIISYMGSNDTAWQQLTTTNTSPDGTFSAEWSPTVGGNYVINATYVGDSTHMPVFATVNAIVLQPSENAKSVLSVDSNSTVTDLAFNSGSDELSFFVSGENGTAGYAQIYISKSLVDDPSKIQASIDGEAANFTVSSAEDSWVLYFSYHHSSHNIMFTLNNQETISTPEMPQAAMPLVIVILIATAAATVTIQRRHRNQRLS